MEFARTRREAMMEKYPPQNSRENVSAVLTRNKLPVKATPLGLAKRNSGETWENAILLTEAGKMNRSIRELEKQSHNKDFASKAATGWQTFQIDEVNRKYYGTDSGFRRWKEAFGDPILDDDFYRPSKNWSADANNTFGYLYSQNKEDAYRYAGTLNKAYKQSEDGFAKLREKAEDKFEDIKEFGQRIWDNHIQAQQRNSEAQTESAKMIGEGWDRAGKWVADKARTAVTSVADVQAKQAESNRIVADEIGARAKDVGQKAWNHHAENAREHSRQSVQVGKNQADAALRAGNAAFQGAGNLAVQQAESQKELADQVGKPIAKYYTDFQSNPDAGKILAQSTKVTGSDQTGASIFGFREDKRMKQPQNHWDKATFKEYQTLKNTNPKDAEQFAVRVNEVYHREKNKVEKQSQIEQIKQQTEDDYLASLHSVGARMAAPMKTVDGYNSLLEYAATGKIIGDSQLSFGEYSQTADDAIANRLEKEHGELASGAYRFGAKAFDGITTYAVGGPTTDILRSAGEASFDSLQKAQTNGVADKQAAENAFWKGAGEAAVDMGIDRIFKNIYIEDAKTKSEKWKNEGIHFVESSLGAIAKNDANYEEVVEEYKKKGFSDKHAKHIATAEMITNYGSDVLKSVTLDVAQRKFAESLERSFRLKK